MLSPTAVDTAITVSIRDVGGIDDNPDLTGVLILRLELSTNTGTSTVVDRRLQVVELLEHQL